MERTWNVIAICLATATMTGCLDMEQSEPIAVEGQEVVQVGDSNLLCSDLIAGQQIDAGDVCVHVEGSDLIVTFTTTGGWEIGEAHTWVGTTIADMPQTRRGAPRIGNFPYNSGDIMGATSHTVTVPLSQFGLTGTETSCDPTLFIVAAHAAVVRDSDGDGSYDQGETAWGAGERFVERGTWATYFTGDLTCTADSGTQPDDKHCENAFAYDHDSNTCFLLIDEDGDGTADFEQWGWTNGPLGGGLHTLHLYAGASQCDVSDATLVGTVSVTHYGTSVLLSTWLNHPYTLADIQYYVGDDLLPADGDGDFTVAPGDYPQVFEFTDDPYSHTSSSFPASGDVNIVTHATVCGF